MVIRVADMILQQSTLRGIGKETPTGWQRLADLDLADVAEVVEVEVDLARFQI